MSKYKRISVSIPVELFDRVKKFNESNRTRPINISATCCIALEKELDDEEFMDEIIDIGYQFYEEDEEC